VTTVMQLRFEYAALDADTRAFVLERTERIHNLARMTAASIVKIGEYLTEVKERLGHGKFLEWIEREFAWTYKSAERFMHVSERFTLDNLSNIEIDVSALYLIAAPSTPEPVREEAIRRASNGEPVSHASARALVHRFAATGEIPDVKVSLPELVAQERAAMIPRPEREEPRILAPDPAEKLRQKRAQENSAKMHAIMLVIQAIEEIHRTAVDMSAVAATIDRLDTPDQDWRGQTRGAADRLRALCKELQL